MGNIMCLYEAFFHNEGKTRFKCTIKFNNEIIECYVPCSCKISKLYELKEDQPVLITSNSLKEAKLKFSLIAIGTQKKNILLNPLLSNYAYKNYLQSKKIEAKSEFQIDRYRADFFVEAKNEIIEVKSILSDKAAVLFPQVHSSRFISQLKEILLLLEKKYKCTLLLSVLNPNIKKVLLDNSKPEGNLIKQCIGKGLKINLLNCILDNNNIPIMRKSKTTLIYN